MPDSTVCFHGGTDRGAAGKDYSVRFPRRGNQFSPGKTESATPLTRRGRCYVRFLLRGGSFTASFPGARKRRHVFQFTLYRRQIARWREIEETETAGLQRAALDDPSLSTGNVRWFFHGSVENKWVHPRRGGDTGIGVFSTARGSIVSGISFRLGQQARRFFPTDFTRFPWSNLSPIAFLPSFSPPFAPPPYDPSSNAYVCRPFFG